MNIALCLSMLKKHDRHRASFHFWAQAQPKNGADILYNRRACSALRGIGGRATNKQRAKCKTFALLATMCLTLKRRGNALLRGSYLSYNEGDTLRGIGGEIRVVMEHTGMYWRPVALTLKQSGFFVSVVNAMLIHDFSDNTIRKVKTDKADSLKIANYALTFWKELRDYSVEDETRQMLKTQSRLYERTLNTSIALRNGLISLLDRTFPGANRLFDEQRTKAGHIKWVDFVRRFWHKDCVAALSLSSFADTFPKWCKRTGYHYSHSDAERIHGIACNSVATLTKNDSTKMLTCLWM